MATDTKKPPKNMPAPELRRGISTTVFLPEDISTRLADYIRAVYGPIGHKRNTVIIEALDEKLQREGY